MKVVSALMALALVAGSVQGGLRGDCCQGCGCNGPCKKVTCKIVTDKVKETHHFYVCECEDFCVPAPAHGGGMGRKCGECCDKGCGGCDSGAGGCDAAGGCGKDDCGCCPPPCPASATSTRGRVIKYECEYENVGLQCELVELCGTAVARRMPATACCMATRSGRSDRGFSFGRDAPDAAGPAGIGPRDRRSRVPTRS